MEKINEYNQKLGVIENESCQLLVIFPIST